MFFEARTEHDHCLNLHRENLRPPLGAVLRLISHGVGGFVLLCLLAAASEAASPFWSDSFRTLLTRGGEVRTVQVPTAGEILIQGDFKWVGLAPRNGVARLKADGGLDTGFDPGRYFPGVPQTLAALPNGQFYVAGATGLEEQQVMRFDAGGTPDPSYRGSPKLRRLGFASAVRDALDVLPLTDGKLLVGGFFHLAGEARVGSLARLNADGTLDADFSPTSGFDQFTAVTALALREDGSVVVQSVDGAGHTKVGRLLSDGSLDAAYSAAPADELRLSAAELSDGRRVQVTPGSVLVFAADGSVLSSWTNLPVTAPIRSHHYAALEPGGKLLVTGFGVDAADGLANFGLVRLNTDGTIDPTFAIAGGLSVPNLGIHQLEFQGDGKLLVLGDFTLADAHRVSGLVRVNTDGSLDRSFVADASGRWDHFAAASDGSVIITGSQCNEQACQYGVYRLGNDGSLDPGFSFRDLFCEVATGLWVHPNGRVWVQTHLGAGGCWSNGEQPFKLVSLDSRDGGMVSGFQPIFPLLVNTFGGSFPGRVELLVPASADGAVFIAGEFNRLGELDRRSLARLRPDGRVDEAFHFTATAYLGHGFLGLEPLPDGGLRALTAAETNGFVLRLASDGALLNAQSVQAQLPLFPLGAGVASDHSWIIAGRISPRNELVIQRISPTGRLVAQIALPFQDPSDISAFSLDVAGNVMLAGPALPDENGHWSGVRRINATRLAPVQLRLMSVEGATSQQLQLRGVPETQLVVQVSSDLRIWSEFARVMLDGNGAALLSTLPTPGSRAAFFQAIEIQP